jgi:hypothetical protein
MRWSAVVLGLLAAYTVAGFWGVPFAIRHQLPRFAQSELARQASIGDVRFNPFTLRLQAADLRLSDADATPLLSIGELGVELQWRSLVRRAWSFADIRIAAPSVNLLIAPDGKFNLAELIATWQKRPQQPSSDASLPRLVIEHFALLQGKVDMNDRRAGYSNTFAPINFELAHFSTLPDQSDAQTFSARSARGGAIRWKGTASVNPIRASGELTLDKVSLSELTVYLKSFTRATIAAGELSATLPYAISYNDGKLEAKVTGAQLSLRDLALAREAATDSFASLTRLDVKDLDADLARREAVVGELRAEGGKLSMQRDAKGQLDLANLMISAAGPAAAAPAPVPPVAPASWKLAVKQIAFDQVAISAVDHTVTPPLQLDAGKARLQLQLAAEQAGADLRLKVSDAAFSLADVALKSGTRTPLQLGELGFSGGTVDLAARRATVDRVYLQDANLQLARDRAGKINLVELLPRFEPAAASSEKAPAPTVSKPGDAWTAVAKSVEVSKFAADIADEESGVKVHVADFAAKLSDAGSNLKQRVKFDASLKLREGGQLSAKGTVVPETAAVQADVRIAQLALAPLQPLLAQHLKLKIVGGAVSAQGRLTTGSGGAKSPKLHYTGSFDVAGLKLNEEDGDLFASWKNVGAAQLTASLEPNRLDIPELRVVEPDATLIIEADRSLNAARLLVHPAAASAKAQPKQAAASSAADDPFPVRIRRIRLQNAKLAFTDLSLQPQFAAKIFELGGVVNGLSTNRASRSQIELDGRVDEFGLARIRGELNPFAPSNNTDVSVVFKNVDMVPTSPYTMKFAGYKIAEGKISLDLQYKVRQGQLEGANQIVIDKLRLGERVESPDALKLPLELAIAILKDSDGRIDLGLPVSGNLDDPQFSYGAVIWKAIGNLLTRIVTAPFRALGAMLGGGGEKLESIAFDPGSARLLPPEREKLKQVAQVLAKRSQLKLSVPGQYSEAADGAALRARAVRLEVSRRAGIKLEPGEEPGPLDLGNRKVRSALREFYAARFGDGDLDKEKKAAETAAPASAAASAARPAANAGNAAAAQPAQLALWERVGKMIQGEPQVADASAFYTKLRTRLEQAQPLPADALAQLGTQRANAIIGALKESGTPPERAVAKAPEKVDAVGGKTIALKLGLGV